MTSDQKIMAAAGAVAVHMQTMAKLLTTAEQFTFLDLIDLETYKMRNACEIKEVEKSKEEDHE